MASLCIKGKKSYIKYMKSSIKKEHPSTKTRMKTSYSQSKHHTTKHHHEIGGPVVYTED